MHTDSDHYRWLTSHFTIGDVYLRYLIFLHCLTITHTQTDCHYCTEKSHTVHPDHGS